MYADFNGFIKSLAKTKICNFIKYGKPCPYGDNCTFAHSVAELRCRKTGLNLIDGPTAHQCVKSSLCISPKSNEEATKTTPEAGSPSSSADSNATKKVSFQDSKPEAATIPLIPSEGNDNVWPLLPSTTLSYNPFGSVPTTPPPP
eukprot:scaffold4940_cov55-Cyclotella_meneghiniana.AAC.1